MRPSTTLLALVLALGALAACTASDPGPEPPEGWTEPGWMAEVRQAEEEYVEATLACYREHGVEGTRIPGAGVGFLNKTDEHGQLPPGLEERQRHAVERNVLPVAVNAVDRAVLRHREVGEHAHRITVLIVPLRRELGAVLRHAVEQLLLEALSGESHTAYGAEAYYLLCKDAFDSGDFEKAETMIYNFADTNTPQEYWIARSFILLGDIFAERGEWVQAKATYESVQNGYNPSEPDDIAQLTALRIQKSEEAMLQ